MDPHYWPSIYPGIIVGVIFGFAHGGVPATIIGGLGGLAGAALALQLEHWLKLDESLLSLLVLVGLSAACAKALLMVYAQLNKSQKS